MTYAVDQLTSPRIQELPTFFHIPAGSGCSGLFHVHVRGRGLPQPLAPPSVQTIPRTGRTVQFGVKGMHHCLGVACVRSGTTLCSVRAVLLCSNAMAEPVSSVVFVDHANGFLAQL